MCCVIIFKPEGVIADKELLELRFKSNNDSWGIASGSDLFVGVDQSVFWRELNASWIKDSFLIHFRTATSGKEKDNGVQPITLKNDTRFFLNGNLKDYFGKDEPDTVLYAREYLDKLPDNFLENKEIMEKITEDAKINNAKMAFMDKKGKVYLINDEAGVWEKGIWFSNPRLGQYAGFGFSGIYPYKEGEKRYNL